MVERSVQLEYSQLEPRMLDEAGRRYKGAKIIAVLQHFLGVSSFAGLRVLDIGTSAGFIASELARAGGAVVGVDIDVPGVAAAAARHGDEVSFLTAEGEHLPVRDSSMDLVVFNQIYEHVLNADAVMAEIRRVLRPEGVAYLGLCNRLVVVEPHYGLPFLSWLPERLADSYVRVAGRSHHYHERLRTHRELRRMVAGMHVWDYSLSVVAEPARFAAENSVPGLLHRVPSGALRAAEFLMPTYLWVGSLAPAEPRGPRLRVPPRRVQTLPHRALSSSASL